MNDLVNVVAAATSVPSTCSIEGTARMRRTLPPVLMVQGTGLSVAKSGTGTAVSMRERIGLSFGDPGFGAHVRALGTDGVVDGVDQVQAAVVIPAAYRGIPPRRTPSRC